jgi:nitroreductase
MQRRRSVRNLPDRPVPRQVIVECLIAAGTAPSGANVQPWHFVVLSDPASKHRIRVEAEKEESEFCILVTGHPVEDTAVADISKKSLDEVVILFK